MNLDWPVHSSSSSKLSVAIQKPSHAYIFAGPKGVGAYRVARLFAAGILLDKEPARVLTFSHSNLLVIKAASGKKKISVAQIHELTTQVHQTTFDSNKPRIVIIRQAELLSPDASAALLKTLEEPPGNTVFVLTTNNRLSLLATIRSRATSITLAPMEPADLAQYIQQHSSTSAQQALELAEAANGHAGAAFSLLRPSKLMAHQHTQKIADEFSIGTISEKFAIAKQVYDEANFGAFLERLYFSIGSVSSILVLASNQELILQAEQQFAGNVNPRLILENVALHWSNPIDS